RGRVHVLPVSARSEGALDAAARAYAELLAADAVPAGELCAAAALRRGHHDQRLAVVGETAHELAEGLEAFLSDEHRAGVATGRRSPGTGKPALLFSGTGAQWARMGPRLLA